MFCEDGAEGTCFVKTGAEGTEGPAKGRDAQLVGAAVGGEGRHHGGVLDPSQQVRSEYIVN